MTDTEIKNENEVYLTKDAPINGQKFACLSIITPQNMKNCKISSLKIRGVYETIEEAKERAKNIQKVDPNFNIYIAEVGAWVPISEDDKYAEDIEYQNEELNTLMKGYKENQIKAKMHHEKRKNDLIAKTIAENEEKKKKQELEEKENDSTEPEPEPELQDNSEISQIFDENNDYNNLIEKGKKEIDDLNNNSKEVRDKLNKAKELYNKLDSE